MRILGVFQHDELVGKLIVDAGIYVFYYMPGCQGKIVEYPDICRGTMWLLPFFTNRTMNKSRPDRKEYLAKRGLDEHCSPIDELVAFTTPDPNGGWHFKELYR